MPPENLVHIIPSEERHSEDQGWLQTSWLFSFDDYFDPDNMEFGGLRVFNDDIVAPGKGFPAHRHSEMEIVTLVLDGALTHRDSAGNEGMLKADDVQVMSAGTGVLHSEMNLGKKPVHLYQIWFLPDRSELRPSYAQGSFPVEGKRNVLVPLASGEGREGALPIHSPATLYRSVLDEGQEIMHDAAGRLVFVYVTRGSLQVDERLLRERDQARIVGQGPLRISAKGESDLVLIDMPWIKGNNIH